MARPLNAWRSLSTPLRIGALFGALALLVAGVAAAGYLALKRPGDITNPDAAFIVPEEEEQGEGKEKEKAATTVEWPLYGYDHARTKFLPTDRIRPPFRRIWRYDHGTLVEFAPIAVDGSLYAIDLNGVFFALDARSGRLLWKRKHGSLNASSPAYSKGRLYAVNLEPPQALALDAENGKVIWKRDLPGRSESSPIVAGGLVHFGDEDGRIFALRASDGKKVWETKVEGAVKAAPALHEGKLYVGDYAGQMYAIRAADGKVVWKTSDLGVGFGRSGRFYSTPAVAFGRVYVGNVDGRVYSFEEESGKIAWTHSAGGYVYSGIAAANTKGTKPAVYFGSHDARAYALDARSGKQIWEAKPGGQVSGPATVIGKVAYVSTFNGNATVGFNVKSGKRVFKVNEGEYGPVVSDGRRMYLVGDKTIMALRPVSRKKRGQARKGSKTKGVVPGKPREVG